MQVLFSTRQLAAAVVVFMALNLNALAQFTVAFWGDSRSNSNDAMENIAGYLVEEQGKTVDVHWQNGDFTQGGSVDNWDNSWDIPNVRAACVKDYFYMCTSNHDMGDAYQGQMADILPSNGSNVYYSMTSWEIPGSTRKVHLLMFDLYQSSAQEQIDYFTPRLSAVSPNDWICAMWHAPSFNGMTYKTEEGGSKDDFMQFLEPSDIGGDFVLNGHAHQYRRTHVLDWDARVVETTGGTGTTHSSPFNSYGLVHIVNGRGGVFSSDASGSGWDGNAFAPTLNSSVGLVTLMAFDDDTLTMRTIEIGDDYKEGEELDSWVWIRPNAQAVQVTLTASAVNGRIDADPPASGTYENNTAVTLTAVPDPGYQFSGWSGDLTGLLNPAPLVMRKDMSVTAEFCLTSECELNISASAANAAEETVGGGTMYLTSSDLELPRDGGEQIVGVNFSGLAIAHGADITSAYVQFTVDEATSGNVTLQIYGHDTDNSPTFSSGANDISSRAATSATVTWSPPDWNSTGAAGADQRTADISSIIEEIVGRPGWSSGNAITIIFKRDPSDGGTNSRTAETGAQVELIVEYKLDDGLVGATLPQLRDLASSLPSITSGILELNIPVKIDVMAVYSISGAKLLHRTFKNARKSIDLQSLQPGHYILQFTIGDNIVNKSIMKFTI